MTIKEQLMRDSWDYDFPMSNRHAESIVNSMYNFSVDFLNDIKEYEKESGNRICDDKRNSFELLDIYIKKKKFMTLKKKAKEMCKPFYKKIDNTKATRNLIIDIALKRK